jgi:predicted homoserine dehydrogenase-like protein
MELLRKLKLRVADNNPVSVGIVGCGQMGSGLAHTINNIKGMQVNCIADIDVKRAIDTIVDMGVSKDDIIETSEPGKANDAIKKGKRVVTGEALVMADIDKLEANVEATGIPDMGARMAITSIERRKPIIMLNAETDITIGAILDHKARKNGALYTVASGDEPGVCKMLYEQAVLMGFEVIAAGKGKNNPMDLTATPESCMDEALSKDMNPKMLASFKDGTKTMVEMAAVSNATGLLPDTPGMHGPKAELEDLVNVFKPKADGGIFNIRGAVDYSTGSIAPGVFVIVYSDDKRIQKDMKFITHADGPYYLLFRPYHLCDIETPQSIAEAVLLNEVTVAAETMNSEVVTIAKRDLKAGETLKGIGSADIFGRIYTYKEARMLNAVPIGIAENARIIADVRKGEPLTALNCMPDNSTFIYSLRQEQDKMLGI